MLRIYELKTPAQHEQALAHNPNGERIDHVAVDKSQIFAASLKKASDLGDDELAAEFGVSAAIKEEFLERHDVDGVGGHASIDFRPTLFGFAHGTGMTRRAVQKSALYTHNRALGGANR